MPNRLASETSPYLLQHADNPVDWYPWGDEAFARARSEDKPVLVSIGYAACHWCHVMEHESFEDASVADVMNARFVCIKVDREERPDVDAIYMDAVQAMTGQGGWPLNAFLTPDGVPFWAGTYFPPQPRQGLPSWRNVLDGIADAWVKQRDEITEASSRIVPRLQGAAALEAPDAELSADVLEQSVAALRQSFDGEHGGWGGAPKFPASSAIEFLLARGETAMPLQTLRRMAAGGIYDQIGGGFARYSVDAHWLVPHFEKMLYDNALLARAYLHAFQVSGDSLFRRVCEETLDWAMRELRQDEGGFASSLDADSEGVEGKFYVWTVSEIVDALGDELGPVAVGHFGVTEGGNFEGRSILVRATSDPPELGEIKAGLLAARASACPAGAGRQAADVMERADDLGAGGCGGRVGAGRLSVGRRGLREFHRGRTAGWVGRAPAHVQSWAREASGVPGGPRVPVGGVPDAVRVDVRRPLVRACGFARRRDLGAVLRPGARRLLLHGRRPHRPDRAPQGSRRRADPVRRLVSVLRPAAPRAHDGESRFEDAALSLIRLLHTVAPPHPLAFGHLLRAIDFYLAPVREVALVGDDVRELAAVVRGGFHPHVVLAGGTGDIPLLEGRTPVDGQAAAYVCERFTCQRPVTSAEELAKSLQI